MSVPAGDGLPDGPALNDNSAVVRAHPNPGDGRIAVAHGGQKPAPRAGASREEELVVVAARHRRRQGFGSLTTEPLRRVRFDGNRVSVDGGADAAGLRDALDGIRQSVAQVDARRRGAVPPEQQADAGPRFRKQVSLYTGFASRRAM